MNARNPINEIISVITTIAFLLVFFSPILVSFFATIYNLVRYLISKKDGKDSLKYKNRIKIALIIFVVAFALYFAFFYWLSVNWHM